MPVSSTLACPPSGTATWMPPCLLDQPPVVPHTKLRRQNYASPPRQTGWRSERTPPRYSRESLRRPARTHRDHRGHRHRFAAIRGNRSQVRRRTADRRRHCPRARRQPDCDSKQEPRRMMQTSASRQPPATRHAGRCPILMSLARTCGREGKPGRIGMSASRRVANSASPAPQPGQNRSAVPTLSGWQHPTPTGATISSARPVSQASSARAGPTVPPCTVRPNRAPRMPDLSQAGDLANIGHPRLDRS